MKSTSRRSAGQAGAVENTRREHAYVQMPIALLCLPTGERAAAIEVWAALHHHLRLGSSPRRITDEELAGVQWLVERSAEHGRKGLEILERLGLISREAAGSSRRVAILARLRGAKPAPQSRGSAPAPPKPVDRPRCDDPAAGRAWEAWQLVRGN